MPEESIPHGYCQCGCGEKTAIVKIPDKRRGEVRGAPRRFLAGHNSRLQRNQFDLRYIKGLEDECWPFIGRLGWDGKGRFGNPSQLAHRVAYERSIGPLKPSDEVTHVCGNPICVNPKHLTLKPPLPNPPNPGGICQCGCGLPAPIAVQSSLKLGHRRGEPMRFRRGHAGARPRSVLSPYRWEAEDRGYVTPCWIWRQHRDITGYGRVTFRGSKTHMAHRAAYEEAKGPIPNGYLIHHRCGQKACINPEHLEAVTRHQHARITFAK